MSGKYLPLLAFAAFGATAAEGRGQPEFDVALDCQMLRASDPKLPIVSWTAREDEPERFVWLFPGQVSSFRGYPAGASFAYRGSYDIFVSTGAPSVLIDWPHRVELGATSAAYKGHRVSDFRLLKVDRSRARAKVVVIQQTVPEGTGFEGPITDGYFGDCRVHHGRAARRQYESMD